MAEKTNRNCGERRETVCIDVDRVLDSCLDKECLTDVRVYFPEPDQQILNGAKSVRPINAELVWTYIDVEALPFNKGFYTVDIRYYFKCFFDAFAGIAHPTRICGLAAYDKRVILYGSEGGANIYSSVFVPGDNDIELMMRSNLPKATVEVVQPILLAGKVADAHSNCGCCNIDLCSVPSAVCGCFENMPADACGECDKRLYATLGLFSIIRILRNVQIVVPSYDFCIPDKQCCSPGEDDPCCLFNKMEFPYNDFFPPVNGRDCCPGTCDCEDGNRNG